MDIFNSPGYRSIKNISTILPFLFLFINTLSAGAGDKIISVQSSDIAPYQEALNGFQSVCSAGMEKLVISKMKDKDIVKEIRKSNPSIILSIGMDALKIIKDIDDIPVIYLMVPNPQSVLERAENITGVRMNISQEDQVSSFLKAVPSMKNIGLIYNPDETGYLAQRAIEACRKAGLNPIAGEVRAAREAPSEIKKMEGEIDGFWMLPDVKAFSPETIEYLFLFTIKNRVPIFTFSGKYLESGALISIGMDSFDMGAQAGEMALEILSGKSISEIRPADARKEDISINLKVSGKLGISIDEDLFAGAEFRR